MTDIRNLQRLTRPPRHSRRIVTYHGRTDNPLVHTDERGRKFIMVRAMGGGVKRLYEGQPYYPEPTRSKEKKTKRVLIL